MCLSHEHRGMTHEGVGTKQLLKLDKIDFFKKLTLTPVVT